MKHRVPRRVGRGERFRLWRGAGARARWKQARLLVRAERRRHRLHAGRRRRAGSRRHAVVLASSAVRTAFDTAFRASTRAHDARGASDGRGTRARISNAPRVPTRVFANATSSARRLVADIARRVVVARAAAGIFSWLRDTPRASAATPGLAATIGTGLRPTSRPARLPCSTRFGVPDQRRPTSSRAIGRVGRRTRGRRRLRRRLLVVARPRLVLARPRLRSRRRLSRCSPW